MVIGLTFYCTHFLKSFSLYLSRHVYDVFIVCDSIKIFIVNEILVNIDCFATRMNKLLLSSHKRKSNQMPDPKLSKHRYLQGLVEKQALIVYVSPVKQI